MSKALSSTIIKGLKINPQSGWVKGIWKTAIFRILGATHPLKDIPGTWYWDTRQEVAESEGKKLMDGEVLLQFVPDDPTTRDYDLARQRKWQLKPADLENDPGMLLTKQAEQEFNSKTPPEKKG